MAFSTIIRRVSSSLKPLTKRTLGVQISYFSSLVIPPKKPTYQFSEPSFFHFSSIAGNGPSSDDSFFWAIKTEIMRNSEDPDLRFTDEIPEGFPFEIEDNLGEQTIVLASYTQEEEIKVEVHMPDLVTDEEHEVDGEKIGQSSIPLVVTVSRYSPKASLVFDVTVYPDEVTVNSLSVKKFGTPEDQIPHEGPDFPNLNGKLQKAFHRYLEVRGIHASIIKLLYEYMIDKDSREYLVWLKNLKKFVEK